MFETLFGGFKMINAHPFQKPSRSFDDSAFLDMFCLIAELLVGFDT